MAINIASLTVGILTESGDKNLTHDRQKPHDTNI